MPDHTSQGLRRRIPWTLIRLGLWVARKATSSKPEPDIGYFSVECTHAELRKALGKRYFESNWELSYFYRGEVENLRRVVHVDDELPWRQVHLRSWNLPGEESRIKVRAHMEPEPFEHPSAHLNGEKFSRNKGMTTVGLLLDRSGISYRYVPGSSNT